MAVPRIQIASNQVLELAKYGRRGLESQLETVSLGKKSADGTKTESHVEVKATPGSTTFVLIQEGEHKGKLALVSTAALATIDPHAAPAPLEVEIVSEALSDKHVAELVGLAAGGFKPGVVNLDE